MPEKQKTRSWKNPKTIIAAASVTVLLTLWNTFATNDRRRTGEMDELVPTPSVAPEAQLDDDCPAPNQIRDLGMRCVTVTHTRSS